MKRFIAGATCPSCHKEDTLYFLSDDNYETVYCSRCNHEEKRSQERELSDETKEKSNPVKWH